MKIIRRGEKETHQDIIDRLPVRPPLGRTINCYHCGAVLEVTEETVAKKGSYLFVRSWTGIYYGWYLRCPQCSGEIFEKARKKDFRRRINKGS